MKKLFFIPLFVVLFSGARPGNVEPRTYVNTNHSESQPVNTKLDSINIKAAELNHLIKQL